MAFIKNIDKNTPILYNNRILNKNGIKNMTALKPQVGDILFSFYGAMHPTTEGKIIRIEKDGNCAVIEEPDGTIRPVNIEKLKEFEEFLNPKPNSSQVGIYLKR